MEFSSLSSDALLQVFSHLAPKDLCRTAATCHDWRRLALDDHLWRKLCWQFWRVKTKQGPPLEAGTGQRKEYTSFYQTWLAWQEKFWRYQQFYARMHDCWSFLDEYISSNFSEAEIRLNPPATEERLNELEDTLDVKLPDCLRLLYRFHDGQSGRTPFFGYYGFYDKMTETRFFDCRHVCQGTEAVMKHMNIQEPYEYVLIAAALQPPQKYICVNVRETSSSPVGNVHVLVHSPEVEMPACPASEQQDGILCWLEEYARRLKTGYYQLRDTEIGQQISLYPQGPPQSRAVTHGVEVRGSPLFVPELSCTSGEEPFRRYFFAYSIQVVFDPRKSKPQPSFSSCQLDSRHWIIHDDGQSPPTKEEVKGKAVIGQTPHFDAASSSFVYESCTHFRTEKGGRMRGSFTFYPGSLTYPTGPPFEVEVAEMEMRVPDYIF